MEYIPLVLKYQLLHEINEDLLDGVGISLVTRTGGLNEPDIHLTTRPQDIL